MTGAPGRPAIVAEGLRQSHHRPGRRPGPALGALAWLAGLLVVFVPLAARAFRRA